MRGPSSIIEVFADIWCPFTHVGLRAVHAQRGRAGRTDVALVVRAWPLEWVNGHPMDAAGARQHADELRDQVAPAMFAGLDPEHFPTSTVEALALVARAYRTDVHLGEKMSFELRDALFERGENISDPAVLARCAATLGVSPAGSVDRAAVQIDWDEGRARGVLGSPHFFCGSRDMFCPSLRITSDAGDGLSIGRDTERLAEFVARCLAPAPPA